MKRIIEKIKKFFKNILKNTCPDCGEPMENEMFDMVLDCIVYKCPKCGKRWM